MKFTKAFKAGFEIFITDKMTQPKIIGVSKSTVYKLNVAEIALKAGVSVKKLGKKIF